MVESEELQLVKLLVQELQKMQTKQNTSVDTVTTLWIVLFGLILIQKAFKYYNKLRKHKSSSTSVSEDWATFSVFVFRPYPRISFCPFWPPLHNIAVKV